MKLFPKLALLALFVALVPLSVLGFALIRAQRDEVRALLQERALALAEVGAARMGRALQDLGERVQATVRLVETSTAEERRVLVRAVYSLSDDIVSVTWQGERVSPEAAPGRVPVLSEQLSALDAAIAKLHAEPMQARETLLSEPITFLGREMPSVVWMMCTDDSCASRMSVEISLRQSQRILAELVKDTPMHAAVIARDGRVLLRAGEGAPLGGQVAIDKLQRGRTARIVDMFGETHLAALSENLLLYQSEETAFAVARRMQTATLIALLVSALLSVAAGYAGSSALRRRLQHYEQAAKKIGEREPGVRVRVETNDELGLLGETLNTMASEIESFNRNLQQLVDERTAELRQAQARLVQAARAAAVGHLGAGVAHEIGNPLARIIGHAQLMQQDPGLDSDARESAAKIEAAAQRVDAITKSLLRFSQMRSVDPEDVQVRALVEEAVSLIRHQLEANGLTLTQTVEPGSVRGQRPQLVQALFQLLDNAKNATPPGGVIAIEASARELVVRDTGQGIAPEHLDKLFDPFFTTKTVWDSAGLGLSLVYRIAEDHGAKIEVHSTLGQGTEVRIALP